MNRTSLLAIGSTTVLFALSGCTITSRPDGSRTYEPSVPIFNQIIDTLGKKWHLTEGQKTHYNAEGLAFETVSVDRVVNFGIGVVDKSDSFTQRIREVENLCGTKFTWYLKKRGGQIAEARPGGVIMFDPVALRQYSECAQSFVLLHECGHLVLGHMVQQQLTNPETGSLRTTPTLELEADAWAAERMVKDWRKEQAVLACWELFSDLHATASHPDGRRRVDAVIKRLDELGGKKTAEISSSATDADETVVQKAPEK